MNNFIMRMYGGGIKEFDNSKDFLCKYLIDHKQFSAHLVLRGINKSTEFYMYVTNVKDEVKKAYDRQ